MARKKLMFGILTESEAIEVTYGVAYNWLREHGYSDPTHGDVDTAVTEFCHDRTNTIRRAVAEHLFADVESDESERRYRASKRAFNRVRRMHGPDAARR